MGIPQAGGRQELIHFHFFCKSGGSNDEDKNLFSTRWSCPLHHLSLILVPARIEAILVICDLCLCVLEVAIVLRNIFLVLTVWSTAHTIQWYLRTLRRLNPENVSKCEIKVGSPISNRRTAIFSFRPTGREKLLSNKRLQSNYKGNIILVFKYYNVYCTFIIE